jgi:hypothetical protein
LHFTRVVILQSRQNVYQDENSQETHFHYPLIKMKRATVAMKDCALQPDPSTVISCYLHERRGLFGVDGWESFLIFQSSCCAFIGSLSAKLSCHMFCLFPGSSHDVHCVWPD